MTNNTRHFSFDFRAKRIMITVCLLLSVCAVLYGYITVIEGSLGTIFLMMCLIFIGVLTPIPYIEVVRQFMRSGFKMMLICGAAATFLASIGFFVLSIVPPVISVVVSAFIPLVLCLCLLTTIRKSEPAPVPAALEKGRTRISYKLLMTSLVQGAAYGLGRLYLVQPGISETLSVELVIGVQATSFILAALTLVILVSVFSFDFNLLIYKIGFSLLSIGLLFLILSPLRYVGLVIFSAGYRFIDLLIFALVVYLASAKKLSLNWTASWPTAMLYTGFTIGYVFFGGLIDSLDWISVNDLAALMAVAVLLFAIIAISERNVPGAWGYVELTDEESISNPYREQVIASISKNKKLSVRQHEVFVLMVKGKLRKEIAKELYLSEETIKVHVRNIYSKLEIHSKSEMKYLIEYEERKLIE